MVCSCHLLCGLIVAVSTYIVLQIYLKLSRKWCRSQTCLVGKTVIVTGANTGIGYETALDFAKRGARVILACRNRDRAEEAKSRIISATGNDKIIVKIVDLASFNSIREFAIDINATEEQLDILVNNAGASGVPDTKTEDGLPLLMQINYFGSFLLTNLLIKLLKESSPSRIVNVSSMGAKWAKLDVDTIDQYDASAGYYTSYCNSKLGNILFTQELAKRLKNTGVAVYSLHPGAVKTEIGRNIDGNIRKVLFWVAANYLFRTSEEGAQTTIYTAVAKGIEHMSGEHFEECTNVSPYSTTQVSGLAEKLWQKSEQLVKLKSEELQL